MNSTWAARELQHEWDQTPHFVDYNLRSWEVKSLGQNQGLLKADFELTSPNIPSWLHFHKPIPPASSIKCLCKLWKILKEKGIPDHLTCLLRNLYAGQEATVRTGHGTTDWFQIGKGVHQGCIMSPAYLTYMQSSSGEMLGWRKHKLESRLQGEMSVTSDMQTTAPLWQKVQRNWQASWWK